MQFAELEKFLETAGKKGFLTQSVLKQTSTAIEKMKQVVEQDPDKTPVNLKDDRAVEDVFRRFMTIFSGELSPDSANVYIARIKKAVDNCHRYQTDPLTYKATFGSPASSEKKETKKSKAPKKSEQKEAKVDSESFTTSTSDSFMATYPLRRDFMLNMNLPKDLSTNEVKRLAVYLLSLCEDFNPMKSNVFYHEGPSNYSALENVNSN